MHQIKSFPHILSDINIIMLKNIRPFRVLDISNIKDKYVIMSDERLWTLTTKKELINQIYEDIASYQKERITTIVGHL